MTHSSIFTRWLTWLAGLARSSAPLARDSGGGSRAQGRPEASRPPRRFEPARTTPPAPPVPRRIAWGARVSAPFRRKVIAIAARLDMSPDHLMAVMAFETGRSFDPTTRNRAGSGATGLIQFMPRTATGLGTSTTALARMNALAQLDYVEAYLQPYAGRMSDLSSAYMAVLYPRAVGKPDDYTLFRKGSKAYKLNRGLDRTGDGRITKGEAAARVAELLAEGLRPGNHG